MLDLPMLGGRGKTSHIQALKNYGRKCVRHQKSVALHEAFSQAIPGSITIRKMSALLFIYRIAVSKKTFLRYWGCAGTRAPPGPTLHWPVIYFYWELFFYCQRVCDDRSIESAFEALTFFMHPGESFFFFLLFFFFADIDDLSRRV